MNKLEIKYRAWYQGIKPRLTKLQIPGWAGETNEHKTGDKPQPWHCTPFLESVLYGLELLYPFDTECHIKRDGDEIIFEGDFTEEQKKCEVDLPPFMSFSPDHFGMTSSLDIKVPTGHVVRLETHPNYYTDTTYNVPCALPGHLQTEWWPKIFFVVFKNPMPGQTIIFKKNQPYAQILIVPKKVEYQIEDMTIEEQVERCALDDKINKYAKDFVKNDWFDHKGYNFDDKYKILNTIFAKEGMEGIQNFLNDVAKRVESKKEKKIKKISTRLIKRKK